MTSDDRKGFFKRSAEILGFVEGPSEARSELPIAGGSVLPPPPTADALTITPERALGVVAVYRAVSILGTSVSQMPVGVWRNGAEIDTPSVVKQPNTDLPRQTFMEQTTNALALTGNAFWLLHRAGNRAGGQVINIEVLNPHLVLVHKDPATGKVTYKYNTKTYQAWQVKHLQLMRVPGLMTGVGPIQAAQNEVRGSIDLRNYSDNWFRTSGIPNGILKTEQVLTAEQADAYKARWEQTQAGRGVAVIGQGVTYQPVYLSPADAQFLESRQFDIQQISRMFGIPATYMLADAGNSMTYTNQESIDITFVRYTLMQYLNEIETALTDVLPRGQEAKFKVETLLRADTATRFEAYKTAIEAGFLTVNEVRAKEGLLPLTESQAKPAAPLEDGNNNESGDAND